MRNLLKFLPISLSCLAFIWGAGIIWFAVGLQATPYPDISHRKDAIVVLTGGPKRINIGLDMLAAKSAPVLFISGVHQHTSLQDLLYLWGKPVPEDLCCIVLGHSARNTQENATEIRDWMHENDIRSAYLVTARTHTPRAKMAMDHAFPGNRMIYYPLDDRDTRLKTCLLTLSEYNKTLLTWIKLKVNILRPD